MAIGGIVVLGLLLVLGVVVVGVVAVVVAVMGRKRGSSHTVQHKAAPCRKCGDLVALTAANCAACGESTTV